MALTKIKLDDVDPKATPVLEDSFLMSDSEDDGRGKLVTGTALEEMIATGDTLSAALAGKAPLESPVLTGTPTAPTAAPGTNTTQLATTAFCAAALADKAPVSTTLTTDTDQTITGVKTYNNIAPLRLNRTSGAYYAFQFFYENNLIWRWYHTVDAISVQHRDSVGTYTNILHFHTTNKRVEFPVSPTVPTLTAGNNSTLAANTAFVQDATANAIYDLPVTRSGLVSSGTDVIIFETANAINPAWYDTTHILNVSFFAKNDSGVSDNTTFKVQLYDEGTSTAHTIASITEDTLHYNLLQASIYRASSSSVNCSIQYGIASESGYVSLASGSYKLRVVCTSTLSTIFSAAQVRFTK